MTSLLYKYQHFCFRLLSPATALLTIAQTQSMYRLGKPDEQDRYKDEEPHMSSNRYILVSANSNVVLEDRRLPSHIKLSDGRILLLMRRPRVLDTQKHKDIHKRMYADLFLYIPWENEEQFLREAKHSMEVCQAKWDEYGEAAIDMKNQLRNIIKQAWLC